MKWLRRWKARRLAREGEHWLGIADDHHRTLQALERARATGGDWAELGLAERLDREITAYHQMLTTSVSLAVELLEEAEEVRR